VPVVLYSTFSQIFFSLHSSKSAQTTAFWYNYCSIFGFQVLHMFTINTETESDCGGTRDEIIARVSYWTLWLWSARRTRIPVRVQLSVDISQSRIKFHRQQQGIRDTEDLLLKCTMDGSIFCFSGRDTWSRKRHVLVLQTVCYFPSRQWEW